MTHGPLRGARIVVAVTAPTSTTFYEGQLAALGRAGAEVTLIASPSADVADQCAREGARFVPVEMERAPAPWRDLRALGEVTSALTRLRPDLVVAGTPKAGLLGIVAAAAIRVRCRVHSLHGLRYESAKGAHRRAIWLAQRVTCAAATHVVCVSRSLRDQATATRLLRPGQGVVIGDGSANGIDVERFRRTPDAVARGRALRARIGIRDDEVVVGYLGRLAADKGIDELGAAWRQVGGQGRHLVIAGDVDPTDPPSPGALAALSARADVSLTGRIADPVAFLAAVDLLVLPTLREGFPTAVLEAAAMELPVVATRATGCVDAVIDRITGRLVPLRDPAALAHALDDYLVDPGLRCDHGRAGRARVVERFTRARVHRLTIDFYGNLLRHTAAAR